VDLEAGDIVGLEFSGGFLDSVISGRAFLDTTFVRTIGKEVIVTSNEALANVIKIEGGLAESLRQLQKSTSQAWDTTRQKTRELGEAINRSLERVRGPRDEETTCSCHQHPGPNGEASEHPEQFPQGK
jgi:hypothetical protein